MTATWISLLILAGVSGIALMRPWLRSMLDPPQAAVITHGGLGMLALAVFFAGYHPEGDLARMELVALVIVIASGAMMFAARRRDKRCPRSLLGVHLAGCVGLVISLL